MNITYLLGAGASYNALPVIDELPDRLIVFNEFVHEAIQLINAFQFSQKPTFVTKSDLEKLKSEVNWLFSQMQNHKTVDTLAKKFYVLGKRESDLIRLKKVLIAYFLFEQSFPTATIGKKDLGTIRKKEMPDKRYDSFIATIISKERNNLSLDNKFKVLTWNYDSQFELAYKSYLEETDLGLVQEKLQSFPRIEPEASILNFDHGQFGLVRLNGVAGPLSKSFFESSEGITDNRVLKVVLMGTIAYKFANLSTEELSLFNYSWETIEQFSGVHSEKQNLVETAHEIMKETNILVVIGYSFPNFNRSIDKTLLNDLRNLQKVYVQDVKAQEVSDLIKSSFYLPLWNTSVFGAQVPVIPVNGVDQFFIPPEADI